MCSIYIANDDAVEEDDDEAAIEEDEDNDEDAAIEEDDFINDESVDCRLHSSCIFFIYSSGTKDRSAPASTNMQRIITSSPVISSISSP